MTSIALIRVDTLPHNKAQYFTTFQNFHYINRQDYKIISRLTKQQSLLKNSFILVSHKIIYYISGHGFSLNVNKCDR